MAFKEFDLDSGDSIYCINEKQLKMAFELISTKSESAARIEKLIADIESDFSRNEQAALSFLLIHRLLGSREPVS